jgi:hypothetical protein
VKTKIDDVVATTSFLLLRADGTRTQITVVVGRPYSVDEHEARCPVKIEALEPQYSDICGVDTVQALSLALQFVRLRLEDQLERGHQLADLNDRERYDRASLAACFGST